MKFKYIIIGFNILIILFLLVIALTPVIILGSEIAVKFWISGWPLALVLLASLICLNVFFLLNRRLFMLLEKEDWPALIDYLERRIYGKDRYAPRLVRLLANSYIILSDSAGVLRLEKKISQAKPALLDRFALIFGAARILDGDSAGAAAFFSTRLEKGKPGDPQWVRMFYAFSLLVSRAFEKAETEFCALAIAGGNPLITGLSAFFLSETLCKFSGHPEECRDIAEQARRRVTAKLVKPQDWHREAVKIETEIHAAVIKKFIDQCAQWLYAEESNENNQ